ncbi:hypothetical protein J437_LFUL010527 [Ladona fulva]|uniref:Uncharacterized protein n=1 Tax=Ladona fulva TaxID=123851 RepID=A0A8K0KV96_LADFU|nr:hypothetical protein J437_LFUL010527 [Ladona fulva]
MLRNENVKKIFPTFESHYTRSHNPNRRYLHPDLTLKKRFNEPLLSGLREKIFKKDFDLHFHQPRKDTCQKCYLLNVKIKALDDDDENNKPMEEHDIHLRPAESARKSLKQELASHNSDHYFAFPFDITLSKVDYFSSIL